MPAVQIELELSGDMSKFSLPAGVHRRFQELLDRQDSGIALTAEEFAEAERLIELAETLSLLKLRAERLSAGRAT